MVEILPVERGLPIPPVRFGGNPVGNRYPWHKLEIGDSFFVPYGSNNSVNGPRRAVTQRTGKTFAVRSVTHLGIPGVRVWRTA